MRITELKREINQLRYKLVNVPLVAKLYIQVEIEAKQKEIITILIQQLRDKH